MPAKVNKKLMALMLCGVSAAAISGGALSAADSVGTATIVQNMVVSSRDQVERTLVTHDAVFVDEAVRTGPRSKAKVALKDGTDLTLGPDSEAKLDNFVYDPTSGQASLDVTKGMARFITGSMNHDAYSVKTGTATIGVRGTDFSFITEEKETRLLVDSGEVEVKNAAGQSVTVKTGEAVIIPDTGAMTVTSPSKQLVEDLIPVRTKPVIFFADATGSAGNGNGGDRDRGGTPGGTTGGATSGGSTTGGSTTGGSTTGGTTTGGEGSTTGGTTTGGEGSTTGGSTTGGTTTGGTTTGGTTTGGNPGNNKDVGKSGENPNGRGGYGNGSSGRGDVNGGGRKG